MGLSNPHEGTQFSNSRATQREDNADEASLPSSPPTILPASHWQSLGFSENDSSKLEGFQRKVLLEYETKEYHGILVLYRNYKAVAMLFVVLDTFN